MAVMQEVCRDLEEAYLPAFQACVQQGGAGSVMCSYNALNGTPACANSNLLQKVQCCLFSAHCPGVCCTSRGNTSWLY